MKKLITVLAVIPLIFCGCKNKTPERNSDVFYVTVNSDCGDVYGVHCEYSLGGEAEGGIIIGGAAGTIPRGESLTFDFNSLNFNNPDDLRSEKFQIVFTAVTKNGSELPISAPENWDGTDYALISEYDKDGNVTNCYWEWNAKFGGKYEFTLEGDNEGGYYLYPVN